MYALISPNDKLILFKDNVRVQFYYDTLHSEITHRFYLKSQAWLWCNTLYSKQEMVRCVRSSSRLMCRTESSEIQRSNNAPSAFFSTHRTHTSKVLLHSAEILLHWRPAWTTHITHHETSGTENTVQHYCLVL